MEILDSLKVCLAKRSDLETIIVRTKLEVMLTGLRWMEAISFKVQLMRCMNE